MKMAKKVLQVSPAYYPAISIGGPIFTNLTFSKALVDLGCDVEVLTTTQGLEPAQIADMLLGISDQSEFSYPIWRFRYFGYSHFTFAPGHIFWLLKHIKRFDLVVLQAVWNFPIWISYLICVLYNKPFVVIPHGSIYPETIGLKSSKIKRIFLAVYVRKMLQRASHVLFSTYDEKEKVVIFKKREQQTILTASNSMIFQSSYGVMWYHTYYLQGVLLSNYKIYYTSTNMDDVLTYIKDEIIRCIKNKVQSNLLLYKVDNIDPRVVSYHLITSSNFSFLKPIQKMKFSFETLQVC